MIVPPKMTSTSARFKVPAMPGMIPATTDEEEPEKEKEEGVSFVV